MKIYIYTLSDPCSGAVRYVGKTIDPRGRLASHIYGANKRPHASCCWIQSLLTTGARPAMKIVEEADDCVWQERERYWIAHFKAQGAALLNHTEGGDGIHNPTPETRYRMGASNRGRKFSDEIRKKMGDARRGKKKPDGYGEKLAARNRGRILSAETRAKIGAHHRGKIISDPQRKAVSEAHKGKPKSEGFKQHLRDAGAVRRSKTADAIRDAVAADLSMQRMQQAGFSLRNIGRAFNVCHHTIKARLALELSA